MDKPCLHDVTERDVAATFDGMCPLCMKATSAQKDAVIERLTAALKIYEEKLKNIVSVANSFGPDHPMPISTELCAKEAIESLHSAKGLLRNESSGSNDSLLGKNNACTRKP